jgi:hypothetical protein
VIEHLIWLKRREDSLLSVVLVVVVPVVAEYGEKDEDSDVRLVQ